MGAAVKITRVDHTPNQLRAIAARSEDGGQARRLLALGWSWKGPRGRMPLGRPAWIARPCVIGCSASTKAVWMA